MDCDLTACHLEWSQVQIGPPAQRIVAGSGSGCIGTGFVLIDRERDECVASQDDVVAHKAWDLRHDLLDPLDSLSEVLKGGDIRFVPSDDAIHRDLLCCDLGNTLSLYRESMRSPPGDEPGGLRGDA